MVNRVTLLGNVGTDPKVSGNDTSKNCTFSFATTEKYTRNNGDVVESTEWHRIVTFGKLADFVSRFITKGKQLYIEGKVHTRSYKDDDNVERYVTEIIANDIKLCGKKSE
jgi:single-strand DNA-binding protein